MKPQTMDNVASATIPDELAHLVDTGHQALTTGDIDTARTAFEQAAERYGFYNKPRDKLNCPGDSVNACEIMAVFEKAVQEEAFQFIDFLLFRRLERLSRYRKSHGVCINSLLAQTREQP